MTHKQPHKTLLKKLYHVCTQENTYSLSDALIALGIGQETAREWFISDPVFRQVLSTCYEHCAANIEIAELKAIIPEQKAIEYTQDNDSCFITTAR